MVFHRVITGSNQRIAVLMIDGLCHLRVCALGWLGDVRCVFEKLRGIEGDKLLNKIGLTIIIIHRK